MGRDCRFNGLLIPSRRCQRRDLAPLPRLSVTELLRRYGAGQRDFRGLDLSGLSFRGQNPAGFVFSGVDLRSTDFLEADLRGVNFRGARCGLIRLRSATFAPTRQRPTRLERVCWNDA